MCNVELLPKKSFHAPQLCKVLYHHYIRAKNIKAVSVPVDAIIDEHFESHASDLEGNEQNEL